MSDTDEGEGQELGANEAALLQALQRAYGHATAVEPATGKVGAAELDDVRVALEEADGLWDAARSEMEDDTRAREVGAIVYARCAVVAIAAGDEPHATKWLGEAIRLTQNEELAAEVEAGYKDRERYRMLVHGRYLVANGKEGKARKQWSAVTKGGDDPLARAAKDELKAPRPLKDGQMPSLWTYNGCGVGFYGTRDEWPDGSYATTHCISLVYIPLIPLRAYRVISHGDEGWSVLAREQLSMFAKIARLAILGSIVAVIAGVVISNHYNDPARVVRRDFDRAVSRAESSSDAESALKDLDAQLASEDLAFLGKGRAQRAGAAVVKHTAGFAPSPFKVAHLDHAARLVRRYQGLPELARGGAAKEALLAALDGWIAQLGDKPDTAEARLSLLRHQMGIAGWDTLEPRINTVKMAVAKTKEADWPLDALTVLVDPPTPGAIAMADKIVETIADSPSLLVDAGPDLDTWLGATTASALKDKVKAQRALALDAQNQIDEKADAKKLAMMAKLRPWDQAVIVAQARDEAAAGKYAPAATRLSAIGKPGRMTREARLLLGQISSALGKLDDADVLLTSLLGARLDRFVAASAKYHAAFTDAETRLMNRAKIGDLPDGIRSQIELAAGDDAKREIFLKYAMETIGNDPAVVGSRDAYTALSDIVPVCLAAGTVKLRRAEAMPDGPARSAMLADAERTYLAIRTEAQGRDEFRIGLGEIYARLGKVKESEEELGAVLAKNDPASSLLVARTYRSLGSLERAKTVARSVYDHPTATKQQKSGGAVMLGLLTAGEDEESEGWFRKADQTDPFVRTSLLEIEANRLLRQGKRAECSAKFAQAAREHLATANATRSDGYNNAGVAHLSRFRCSGDQQALVDAAAMFEKAYRANHESSIVVGNFSDVLSQNGRLRVLGKRIDLRAFQPTADEVDTLLGALLDGPDRDAVVADLAADPDIRRGEQVFGEYEVLAPSSTRPYRTRFEWAVERRDETAATAIVERARKAKRLEDENAGTRKQWKSGALDAKFIEAWTSKLARLDATLEGKLDPKTRAAVQLVIANTAQRLGLLKADAVLLQRSREAAGEATKLWPALVRSSIAIAALIDEAGLAADAKAWQAARRERSPGATVLAIGGATMAAIKASPQWAQVAGYLRADVGRPGLDDLRIARLLGDAALETKMKAVLDDKLARLALELALIFDPDDQDSKSDLAYLDRR